MEDIGCIDSFVESINSIFTKQLDKQAPFIRKQVKVQKHMVRNDDIQCARRLRRKAEVRYKRSKTEENKENLKVLRKALSKTVEKARNEFFKTKLSKCNGDVRQTYKVINQLLSAKKYTKL